MLVILHREIFLLVDGREFGYYAHVCRIQLVYYALRSVEHSTSVAFRLAQLSEIGSLSLTSLLILAVVYTHISSTPTGIRFEFLIQLFLTISL